MLGDDLNPQARYLTAGRIEDMYGFVMPVGAILAYGGSSTAPRGWLLCNGTSYNRQGYPELYNVIGTAYGTASSTTFNVPDLRGRFIRGVDGGSGNDPDAASRTAITTGGNTGNNVGSYEADTYTSHSHTHNNPFQFYGGGGGTGFTPGGLYSGPNAALTLNNSGGNETRPKNVYCYYIIKY